MKTKYLNRIADNVLLKKLKSTGAVLIEGPKYCGKTTTASQIAKSILYMQNPSSREQNITMASINPSLLLEGDNPRLIDEWQIAPNLWDAIRFEVDQRNEFAQFILTGSVSPVLDSSKMHSGTGRISRMKMRTMSLFESNDSNGSVSLKSLFNNEEIKGKNYLKMPDISFLIARGGWPKSLVKEKDVALQQAINYYDSLINTELIDEGVSKRNTEKMKALLRSYARSIGSQSSLSSILEDINRNISIDEKTMYSYIADLNNLYIVEDMLAWNPNLRSKTAIRTSNTHYFLDPSIACASLGVGPEDLLNDLNTMGFFFENMCIRDLRVYVDSLNGDLYHFRNKNGLECDCVIHLKNGSYGLVEIKLGGDILISEGINNLVKLSSDIDSNLMKQPSFKMIITAIGDYAYKTKEGIFIVPIGCLKD